MWSIYFENVIDLAEVLNAKNYKKNCRFSYFEDFLSLWIFLGAVFYVYVYRGLS